MVARPPLAAALLAGLLVATPAFADSDAALAALKALAADPAAAQPPELAQLSFGEALSLMDDLTPGERRRLYRAIRDDELSLPGNVKGAVESRFPPKRGGGDGAGGR